MPPAFWTFSSCQNFIFCDWLDAPINVGWGAKHTQFHGSLGKAAATSSIPPTAVGATPDDDGHVRISWRGDGAYFSVSVLEGANEVRAC